MFNKRISIFTGHFGSGKTEVAVNYAIRLASEGKQTAIVDFDIVNPFFRTADVKEELENLNIKVITPLFANTNVDVPAIPPEVSMLFEKKEYFVVFDVGGDDLGAKVLSRYREEILDDIFELFFVINTKRPMTDTVSKIEEMIRDIELSSRLQITKLINNTNLLAHTRVEDILEGQKLVQAVSERTNIPVGFISGFEENVYALQRLTDMKTLSMKKLIKLPWE
ncbi:MAG: hypothetical protein N2645_10300 [Clostridia bacterium]|nr:hypothetical protein [Clostridia bacterium]